MKVYSFHASPSSVKTLTVYAPDLTGDNVGNDCEESMQQGFAWRIGNVDFYTIDDLGMAIDIEVFLNESAQLPNDTIRAIQVPFTVGSKGIGFYYMATFVDVLGTVSKANYGTEPTYLAIPPGKYTLVFAQGFMPNWGEDGYTGKDENNTTSMWGKLWFNLETNPEAKILVKDSQLKPTYPLNMNAAPISED